MVDEADFWCRRAEVLLFASRLSYLLHFDDLFHAAQHLRTMCCVNHWKVSATLTATTIMIKSQLLLADAFNEIYKFQSGVDSMVPIDHNGTFKSWLISFQVVCLLQPITHVVQSDNNGKQEQGRVNWQVGKWPHQTSIQSNQNICCVLRRLLIWLATPRNELMDNNSINIKHFTHDDNPTSAAPICFTSTNRINKWVRHTELSWLIQVSEC